MIQLASLVLDADAARIAANTAGHAGVAHAVAGALLLLPRHRALGQVFIPADILTATGFDRESFLIGSDNERVGNAIRAFSAFGREHLEKARKAGLPPRSVLPAYLPVATADAILADALERGERIFESSLQPTQWKRQIAMMRSLLFRSFDL